MFGKDWQARVIVRQGLFGRPGTGLGMGVLVPKSLSPVSLPCSDTGRMRQPAWLAGQKLT